MYHIIALLIFIISITSIFHDNLKNSKIISIFLFFGLFILASIRYEIGTDYPVYLKFFTNVKPYNFSSAYVIGNQYFEPLFQFTVAILKNIISNPVFYFSLWAFIALFCIWKGIKEQSPNYILSIFIFYCIFYHHYVFNTIRQGITMGIFLISLKYILDRKFIPVFLMGIFASTIHTSGLLIIPSYFISMIRIKNRFTLFSILALSFFIWSSGVGESIFTFIAVRFEEVLPNLVLYIKLFLSPHTLLSVSQRLLILLPLIYFYPTLSKDSRFSKLFSLYFFGAILYFCFGFFGLFITRINMFFRILEILIIPILYEKIVGKKEKIITQFSIMIWGFTILTWLYYKETYYPFKTIFGNFI